MTNSTHTCAICLEDLVIPSPNMCMTECSHIFHLNCLLRSHEHNRTCPLCRADIPNEQQHNNDNEGIEINDNIINEADLIENIDTVLQEIVNGTQLHTSITDIVSNASNNNISNMNIEERHIYIDQIHNLCIEFCNSTFNYLTSFRHLYNINQKITEIVERAAVNDIHNNMTFYRMENDMYDLCLGYTDHIIMNLHT